MIPDCIVDMTSESLRLGVTYPPVKMVETFTGAITMGLYQYLVQISPQRKHVDMIFVPTLEMIVMLQVMNIVDALLLDIMSNQSLMIHLDTNAVLVVINIQEVKHAEVTYVTILEMIVVHPVMSIADAPLMDIMLHLIRLGPLVMNLACETMVNLLSINVVSIHQLHLMGIKKFINLTLTTPTTLGMSIVTSLQR